MRSATRSSRGRARPGVAMVELASILPVLSLLAFATIEASRMCMVAQIMANAARDGCRVAVVASSANSDVTTRVNAALEAAGFSPSAIAAVTTTISPSDVTTATSGSSITVTLSVPFGGVNWLPAPFFYSATTQVTGGAVMRSQRP